MSAKDLLSVFCKNKYLLWLLVIINLGGTVFGIYYYWTQFLKVPLYLLPVVPDSPTTTFLFALALIFIFFKKDSPLITNFAYFGLIKVGLWTLVAMLVYNHYFFTSENILYYGILFVLHGGMILEAFVLRNKLNFQPKFWLPISVFYLIGDICDYYIGTVPTPIPLDRPDLLPILAIESFFVTIALTWYFWKKK